MMMDVYKLELYNDYYFFYFCSFGGGYVKFLYRDHIDAVDFQKGPQQFFKFLAGLQVGKGWIGTLPGCC